MTGSLKNRYPVFIISKGRWESRLTVKTMENLNIPYTVVIEPQEYEQYASVISPKNILVTDFSNLGRGSIPVRNFVWEHAVKLGVKRYWVLDDNIRGFTRIHRNSKLEVNSAAPLRTLEDFVDRFKNVPMGGLNYNYFVPSNDGKIPFYFNTRIYSCILLETAMPQRWRVLEWDGKPAPYNEDTDLSLQFLKAGYCTVLFNAFACGKQTTHSMKGGNTSEIYKLGQEGFDNRYKFAASLQKAHPDCVEVVERFRRWHHLVNYRLFEKNVPIPVDDLELTGKTNEYGLKLVRLDPITRKPAEILNTNTFKIADYATE